MVIALTGGELVYFEMDPSGQLNEYTERKEMSADVVCMALGNVPQGEQRCRWVTCIYFRHSAWASLFMDTSLSRGHLQIRHKQLNASLISLIASLPNFLLYQPNHWEHHVLVAS